MRILISVGILEIQPDVVSQICISLSRQLMCRNVEVTLVGMCRCPEDAGVVFDNGIELVRICRVPAVYSATVLFDQEKRAASVSSKSFSRLGFSIRHPFNALALCYKYSQHFRVHGLPSYYHRQIKRLFSHKDYDAAIGVYGNFSLCSAFATAMTELPLYIYQLDPWSFLQIDTGFTVRQRFKQELDIFRHAQHIFTTPVLLEKYNDAPHFKLLVTKMTAVEFPTLNKVKNGVPSPMILDEGFTNILFCGTLEDSYRNPGFFLEIIAQLFPKKHDLRLTFVGNIDSLVLDEYISSYPAQIRACGPLPRDNIDYLMNQCNFLLNINNTLPNQVPSKIFDYFASGKPLINVQRISNCPSRAYVEKYPLQFTMVENEPVDMDSFACFLAEKRNKKISFEHVQAIFKDATPKAVADTMSGIILTAN